MVYRNGIGNIVLIALVLALALAAVLGFLAVSGQGDVLSFMKDSKTETDTKFNEQQDALKDKIDQSIQEGIESGGIDSGSSTSSTKSGEDSNDGTGSGEWVQKADMPKGVTAVAGTALNGKLYTFGGTQDNQNTNKDPVISDTQIYDPSSDSWSTGPSLPEPMKAMTAASVNGQAYVFAGAEPGAPWNGCCLRNEIYRFEPGNGFTQVGTHPGGQYGAAAVYSEETGLIYVAGGATGKTANSNTIFTFKPETEQVEDANWATLPAAVRWPGAAIVTVDGKPYLHVMGGIAYNNGADLQDFNARYDLETGNQESMASLPTPSGKHARSNPVINNKIYLPMGLVEDSSGGLSMDSFKKATWMYDPENDEWSTDLPEMPRDQSRDVGASAVIDGKLYIAGGHRKLYNEPGGPHDVDPYTDVFTPPTSSGGTSGTN